MLRVQGESMMNIGMYEGDMLIVRHQNTANNGDIVVARIDDEATVKRFYKENGHIRLQPENDNFDPIIVDDCHIEGLVIGLVRDRIQKKPATYGCRFSIILKTCKKTEAILNSSCFLFYFIYSVKALSIYAASSALGSHIGKLNTPAGKPILRTAYLTGIGFVVINIAFMISAKL